VLLQSEDTGLSLVLENFLVLSFQILPLPILCTFSSSLSLSSSESRAWEKTQINFRDDAGEQKWWREKCKTATPIKLALHPLWLMRAQTHRGFLEKINSEILRWSHPRTTELIYVSPYCRWLMLLLEVTQEVHCLHMSWEGLCNVSESPESEELRSSAAWDWEGMLHCVGECSPLPETRLVEGISTRHHQHPPRVYSKTYSVFMLHNLTFTFTFFFPLGLTKLSVSLGLHSSSHRFWEETCSLTHFVIWFCQAFQGYHKLWINFFYCGKIYTTQNYLF
jgi:hypothetical protein